MRKSDMIKQLIENLSTVFPLDTGFRAVRNRTSKRVHRTVDTCLPAVSMREDNREYTNDTPSDTEMCGFCAKKWRREWGIRPDLPKPPERR